MCDLAPDFEGQLPQIVSAGGCSYDRHGEPVSSLALKGLVHLAMLS